MLKKANICYFSLMITTAESFKTRFAPAPTGLLHLGHILSAAYVWGIGRSLGAQVLLRIEDHDRQRSRVEFEEAIFEDLQWLGFTFDNWQDVTSTSPSQYRQRDRVQRYNDVYHGLETYRCNCSRREIAALQPKMAQELRYPGTCRTKQQGSSHQAGLRLRMEDDDIHFLDTFHGNSIQSPSKQCGDLLIRDRNGGFTYNYAVTVDDLDQGINLVIRGEDILHCTGRQLALRRLIKHSHTSDIKWMHHPLLLDEQGRKLGKRIQSETIRKRRCNGESPESLLGEALFRAKIRPILTPFSVNQLPALFHRLT